MAKEQSILTGFADNEALIGAVRDVLLKQFDLDELDLSKPNELLGQMVRAKIGGAASVELAFREIESHRTVPKSKVTENPAY